MNLGSLPVNRSLLAFAHDVAMAGVALAVATWLRVGSALFQEGGQGGMWFDGLMLGLPIFMAIAAVSFRVVGLYRGLWRFASADDAIALVKAVTLALAIFVPLMFLLNRLESMPRSVPIITWFVLLAALGGPRFIYRTVKDGRLPFLGLASATPRIPVLLYGAGDETERFIRAMSQGGAAAYEAVGILDEDPTLARRKIRGVTIYGGSRDLTAIVNKLARRGQRPQRLIVAASETASDVLQRLLAETETLGLAISRLPSANELKDTGADGGVELRPIAVEDLLGRPQRALDREGIRAFVAGKRVLVTGAGGTIGSELARQIAALEPAKITLLDASEFNLYSIDLDLKEAAPRVARQAILADVRDAERMRAVMLADKPDVVFHAAALKHVPMVETNAVEGVLTNVIGTRNVADAAMAADVSAMVLISTDKAVRPSSVMGATKRLAELYCQSLDVRLGAVRRRGEPSTRFITVRFGNVLGSTGSVVPLFKRQLARGGPLTVTHPEVERYFMTCGEAVQLVLQACAYGATHDAGTGAVFVLDMGEPVKIVDLARQVIRLAGLHPDRDVRIEFTGLRDGEKLTERLFNEGEAPGRTQAEGVLEARPRTVEHSIVKRAFAELEAHALARDEARALEMLWHLVPEQTREAEPVAPVREAAQDDAGGRGAAV
jgi:O-antigen biosynthesis protein WbqV